MEKTKLFLDIASGIIVPLLVACIPLIPAVWQRVGGSVQAFSRRLFYPGLVLIALTTAGATIFGAASGFYDRDRSDPLAALTDEARNWFLESLKKNDRPIVKYDNFRFTGIKRWVFLAGRDAYQVERFSGFVITPEPGRNTYDLPLSQQTASAADKLVQKYFDFNSATPIEDIVKEVIPVAGTKTSTFFLRVLPVPERFDVVKVSRAYRTFSFPGTLDSIVVPMQNYTGGYSTFEYFQIFDTSLEAAGVYTVQRNGESVDLRKDSIDPQKIPFEQISQTARETLDFAYKFKDVRPLFEKIDKMTWREAYKISIPVKTTRPISFQFIRKDDD